MKNYWNRLVKVRDNTKDNEIKNRVSMLLSQYNTAGSRMIESEIENFLNSNE